MNESTVQTAMVLVILLVPVVPALAVGCFDCGNWIAEAEWTEPRAYDAFPDAGSVNGFVVEHHARKAGGMEKSATSTGEVELGLQELRVRLAITDDGAVFFTANYKEPISDEAAGRALNVTREALGLGQAPSEAFKIRHLGGTC